MRRAFRHGDPLQEEDGEIAGGGLLESVKKFKTRLVAVGSLRLDSLQGVEA